MEGLSKQEEERSGQDEYEINLRTTDPSTRASPRSEGEYSQNFPFNPALLSYPPALPRHLFPFVPVPQYYIYTDLLSDPIHSTTVRSAIQRIQDQSRQFPVADSPQKLPVPDSRNITEAEGEADIDACVDLTCSARERRCSRETFPKKLHRLLSSHEHDDCISWLTHGRAFKVHRVKEFNERVQPQFFDTTRFASFMRQVNGWGFRRIVEGPDAGAYYHELFLRGLPELVFSIHRTKAKKETKEVPDFYRISMLAPLPDERFHPETPNTASGGSFPLRVVSNYPKSASHQVVYDAGCCPRPYAEGVVGWADRGGDGIPSGLSEYISHEPPASVGNTRRDPRRQGSLGRALSPTGKPSALPLDSENASVSSAVNLFPSIGDATLFPSPLRQLCNSPVSPGESSTPIMPGSATTSTNSHSQN